MRKNLGFTLIEIILVILILGIISTIAVNLMAEGFTSFLTGQDVVDADWQSRLALQRMTLDLRKVGTPTSITTATASQLTFTDFNGANITYQVSGNALMRNSQVLADAISSMNLTYFDDNGAATAVTTAIRYIKVNLTVNSTDASFNASTGVFLRDLS